MVTDQNWSKNDASTSCTGSIRVETPIWYSRNSSQRSSPLTRSTGGAPSRVASSRARAAMEGTSLSEYALGELRRALERPTRAELLERIAAGTATSSTETTAAAVRAERAAR